MMVYIVQWPGGALSGDLLRAKVVGMESTGRKRKTLASLAAELGVSRTTVSNAYNRPDQLAPATRERILAAAAKRGYPGPDPTARSLRTRRAGAIGVLLTERLTYAFEDKASVDFLAGMAEASYGTNASLTLIPAGPDTANETSRAQELLGRAAVDGFVVYSVAKNDPYLEAAMQRGLPLVVCDQPTDTGLPFVGIDDYAAIKPAAQALVDAGHRKIGVMAIRLMHERADGAVNPCELEAAAMHVQRNRIQGALDVFEDAGIERETIPVHTRHINDRTNGREASAQLLGAHPDLTAVLCTTDSMALALIDYAQEIGMRVPEDLSVTGFDGVDTAVARGLSTVVQPNKSKGAAAGQLLQELIEKDGELADKRERKILPTSFHPGATIAPPRFA